MIYENNLIHICTKYRHTCFFFVFCFVFLCSIFFFFRAGMEGRGLFLFLVCFTQQSSLLKPVHLFILLIIWSYVFVFNNYMELLLFRLPNIFILFENTGCLRKMMQNIVKCYIRLYPIAISLSVKIKQRFPWTHHGLHPHPAFFLDGGIFKKVGLDRTSTVRGGLLGKRGGYFFQGGGGDCSFCAKKLIKIWNI